MSQPYSRRPQWIICTNQNKHGCYTVMLHLPSKNCVVLVDSHRHTVWLFDQNSLISQIYVLYKLCLKPSSQLTVTRFLNIPFIVHKSRVPCCSYAQQPTSGSGVEMTTFVRELSRIIKHVPKLLRNHTILSAYSCKKKFGLSCVSKSGI